MAKVSVTATKDFFDGANQTQRIKGSEFVLRDSYAKTLGGSVKIGKVVEPERAIQPNAAPKKARDITTGSVKKSATKKGKK